MEAVPKAASLLSDKIQHGGAYFCLGIAAWVSASNQRNLTILLLLSFILGISIEFLQPLTGRHFEWADMLANSGGLALAVCVCIYCGRRKTPKSRI